MAPQSKAPTSAAGGYQDEKNAGAGLRCQGLATSGTHEKGGCRRECSGLHPYERLSSYFWGFSADLAVAGVASAPPGVLAFGFAAAMTGLGFQNSAEASAI